MRTVIACRRCRASKVKCKHNGQPPCAGCLKTGNTETCVLSGPDIKRTNVAADAQRGKRKSSRQSSSRDMNERSVKRVSRSHEYDDIATAFDKAPRASFTKAITIFQSQFPEFGFLHPDDLVYEDEALEPIQKLRLLALLAVSSQYNDDDHSASGREYAPLVIQELHNHMISSPSTYLIQTFLIIALYEWGESEGFSAWMHTGVASRMAQGILSVSLSYSGKRPLSEIEKRTLWTCFIMDKLLSCGRRRKAMMQMELMDVDFPLNDADFVFGSSIPQDTSRLIYGVGDSFNLIVRGLNIWSKIHGWTVEGGRKQPGMTEPDQCPWQPMSQWNLMKQELLEWRASQDPQLKYPETKAVLHVHLRQAEKFGYINLIYYISLLFLAREYIPFLPVGETRPRGPIDPPLLKEAGPDEFWVENAQDIYHAVSQISNLMRDLRLAGSSIQTPFTGLCAFSSALHNIYLAAFPAFMGFDELDIKKAETQANESLLDLERIGKVWKIAQSWIDVLETGKSLIRRVSTSTQGMSLRSRSHYPELEDSFNLAPLKGMSRPTFDPTHSNANVDLRRQQEASSIPQPNVLDDLEQPSFDVFGSEFMDEEGWRLASFWDDPHLLDLNGPYWSTD